MSTCVEQLSEKIIEFHQERGSKPDAVAVGYRFYTRLIEEFKTYPHSVTEEDLPVRDVMFQGIKIFAHAWLDYDCIFPFHTPKHIELAFRFPG